MNNELRTQAERARRAGVGSRGYTNLTGDEYLANEQTKVTRGKAGELVVRAEVHTNTVERLHWHIKTNLLGPGLTAKQWAAEKEQRCLEAEWRLRIAGRDQLAALGEVMRG